MLKISERIYIEQDVITFQKNKDEYGCFSNMFTQLPFEFKGKSVFTTEHLYQALKFKNPIHQEEILKIKNPIDCKRKAYEIGIKEVRSDWEEIKIEAMKFCISLKTHYHWNFIGKKLLDSYQIDLSGCIKYLVEKSIRDDFWGAKPFEFGRLKGKNVLGRLWMKIREEYFDDRGCIKSKEFIQPPNCNLFFLGEEIV